MLLLVSIVNFADRFLLTGLIGPIKAEFGLGDGMMGLLMGPAFVILYVTAGIPLAWLADRWSRTLIIAFGCVSWSVATIATGMATNEVALVIARACVGIGEAAFAAPAYSLLADYFKPQRRGIAFAILGMATYFGQILGQAGGPAIAAVYDWRMAFYSLGGIGIGLGLLLALLVREPVRIIGVTTTAAHVSIVRLIGILGRNYSFVLMMLAFGLGAMSGISFGFWGPELFARNYGVDPLTAKTSFAINFGMAGLLGTLIFGVVSDKMAKKGMHWPVRLSAIAMGVATIVILAVTWSTSFTLAKWLAVPSGLLGGGWAVGIYSTLQYILPGKFRATATALFLAITTLLSYLTGPWVTGLLSQAFGNDQDSLKLALTIMIPIGLIAAIIAAFASLRIEKDKALLETNG